MTFQTTRRVAIMFAFLFSLFLTMGLLTALPTQGQGGESGTSRDLQPLPGDCTGTSPGDQTPVCCAFGYVLVDGEPVGGVEVEISSAEGSIVASTSESENILYYGASLSDTLRVYPGDWVTFTVSYDGFTVVRTHQAVAGSQQVDLALDHFQSKDFGQMTVVSDSLRIGYRSTEDVLANDDFKVARIFPALATDANGDISLVWEEKPDAFNRLYSTRSDNQGQSWSSDLLVYDDSSELRQELPSLFIDSDDTRYVVWTERSNTIYPFISNFNFAKSSDGGQSWSHPVRIENDPQNEALHPTLAFDRNGTLYAAWTSLNVQTQQVGIYFAKSTDQGDTWSGEVKVSSQSQQFNYFDDDVINFTPSLGVDSQNRVYLAWTDYRNETLDIYFAYSDNQGESWSPNIRINENQSNDQLTPKLAIDKNDTVYVVWSDQQQDEEAEGIVNADIYVAKSTDRGDSWSDKQLYEAPFGIKQQDPQIVVDEPGEIYVAWRENSNNQNDLLLVRSTDEAESWQLIGQINDPDQSLAAGRKFDFSLPGLAVDRSGRHDVYLAWPVEHNAHHADIHVAGWPDKNRFYSHGTYTSEVYDAQEVVAWLKYDAPTTLSADTAITLEVRTGNMPVPDAEWSEWQRFTALPADLTLLPEGQYLQWRTTLSSTDPTSSPILGPPSLSLQSTTTETILLNAGWNLISIPGESSSHQISDVLDSIEGNYEVAQAYNACDASESWQKYDPDSPPFANSLAEVDHRQGLWLNMTASDRLMVESVVPLTTSIPLCTGWNLVGYPSQRARSVDEALESIADAYTIVYGYDASRGAWKTYDPAAPPFANTLDVMKPEYGYWIHVNQEVEWLISNEATNDDES